MKYVIKFGAGDLDSSYLVKELVHSIDENQFMIVTGGNKVLDAEFEKRKIWNGRVETKDKRKTRYTNSEAIKIFEEIYFKVANEISDKINEFIPDCSKAFLGNYKKLFQGIR